ncbi:hypothetical protein [Sporosarcina newyorkensis]|uniref:Uncharacterized protein n=1 Tax=Sporosarcina newyorkensis TaxID=759851 RepID=A0A1T4XLA0_9BACL|nr:hypothetical protein [Sporosarcina newyorkensis]SKA90359.1 hypothetical protein SAMN04244570_0959 [Sporosarcina newyorkensis]
MINGCFPATVTEENYSYHVVHMKDGKKTVVHLPEEKWNYHYIQPIEDGHILLVGARSYYHDAQNIEENTGVYDKNWCLIRSFCLGDGIEHVYVTKNQEIWTEYFDEGVFGNYGWEEPISRSGLVGWDAPGRKMDSLEEDREYSIFECLAPNGDAEGEIWFFLRFLSCTVMVMNIKVVHEIELIQPDGTPVTPQLVSNRENMLLFLDGDELYMFEANSGA